MDSGWPSIAASASMPPTPQPSTPSPLTIGVCESVPTSVSQNAVPSSANTTRARCSRLTWWQIPVPGGTTRSPGSACWPQRRNAYRSALRRYSRSMLRSRASGRPKKSAITEWSMISSAGRSGLTREGSPPSAAIASRIAARSTRHGTPVKSCSSTRAGVKAISADGSAAGSHSASAWICAAVTRCPSSLRSRFSSSTFRQYGSRTAPSIASSRKTR